MPYRSARGPRAAALTLAVRRSLAVTAFMAFGLGVHAQSPDEGVIRLNAGFIDPMSKAADAYRGPVAKTNGKQLHLVQFEGPIQRHWYEALESAGVQIVDFIPDHAYLVYGDTQALARVQTMGRSPNSGIRWDGRFAAEHKINERVYQLESKGAVPDFYSIQLVLDPAANAETLAFVRGADLGETRVWNFRHYVNVEARVPFGALSAIANRPDVISIQPDMLPTLHDERQNIILANRLTTSGANTVPIAPGASGGIGYLNWLASLGFTQAQFDASAFTVDVSDQGLDNGTTQPNHFALWKGGDPGSPVDPSRSLVVYNKLEGTAAAADLTGCGSVGHGTWTSHVVSGNVASVSRALPHGDDSFNFGGGVAPFVRVGNSVFFTTGGSFTSPNVVNASSRAYSNLGTNINGARISNNSWGAAISGGYNANSQAYDGVVRDAQPNGSTHPAAGNQEYVVVVSAGNSGPGAQTMGAPATGKNVIAVGGSQNVRPGITDAVNADAMYVSSSRGPTADQRNKPELIAPATNVAGGVVMNDRSTAAPGNHNTCFTGGFLPTTPQQRFYRTGNGTSFSGPAVAGGAALLRQWFINNSLTPPSPAMTKAYLTSTSTYMASLTDNLPSNNQGMGRMNLERAFDNTPRGLRDQLPADRFTNSGQVRSFRGTVSDASKPFRVALAWTDVPGSTTGNTFVNNLDLRVTIGGQTYLGNRFSGANSTTGGTADTRNNLESVFLPAGVTGPFNITVAATNVSAPADPTISGPNQDFALKVYNTGTLASCPEFAITPETVPTNVVGGVAYPTQTFSASGGEVPPYAFSVAGSLPPGMTVSPAGVLSGTPTAPGTFNFSVAASDTTGCAGARNYSITVIAAEIAQTARTLGGNGILEPNECNQLSVRLTNTGTNLASAISSVLSTTTPGVEIAQAASPYPDLASGGGNALNTNPFEISTGPSVACGSTVNLTQTVTLTGGASPLTFNFAIPVGQAGGNYNFGTPGTGGTIPAGGVLVASSSADDAVVPLTVPFATAVYGNPIAAGATIHASTNGNVQIVASGAGTDFANVALPTPGDALRPFPTNAPILFAFWDDLDLRTTGGGIYTQTTGVAPNRQFVIEWRGKHYSETGSTQTVNFAVVLNEGASGAFEYRYVQTGTSATIANGLSATVGIQAASTGTVFTQSSLNQAVVNAGRVLPATLPPPICSPGPAVCLGGDGVFANGFE